MEKKINDYTQRHTTKEESYLYELSRTTHLQVLRPRMLSGHEQGMLLYLLTRMLCPKRVLELGTYTGYSAISIARGMDVDTELVTIDKNDELQSIVDSYIVKANLKSHIRCLHGDAKQIIPSLKGEFDLVFLDADKSEYITYYDLVFDKVASGGFLLADNVLWSGKVVADILDNDAQTQGIMRFNEYVQNDDRVENLMLPIRDGLSIIRKK